MTITVKVHSIGADGIGRKYQTVSRIARDYEHVDGRESAWIRVDGRMVKAEKFTNTAWVAEVTSGNEATQLVTDLWSFIENGDTPDGTARFFALRERVRNLRAEGK